MLFTTGEDRYDYIFPMPTQEEHGEESYILKNSYNTEDLLTFYKENKDGNSDITISRDLLLERDEYILKVDGNGIAITASCDDGVFRALTSLRQLIRKGNGDVIYSDIHDNPEFKQRGFMYDMSRQRKPKPEYIFELIDIMAGMKYNELQLYMEDLCFKYKAYPEYTADYDCLTAEDIVAIDNYCKERFIELVPHQNGMGHMSAWLEQEELKHLAVTPDTINFLDPEAFELIDNIYGSLLPYFSSKRVHIGLDEATGLGKGQTEAICKEKGKANVFMDWLNKLSDHCEKKYGKTVMFWSDMVDNHPESFSQIPKNAMPVYWGYETLLMPYVERRCRALSEAVDKYYVAPSTSPIYAMTGRFDTAEFNIMVMAEVGKDNNAYGYLLTHWGDPDMPHNAVWSYMPLALAAQYSWNTGVKQHGGCRRPYFRFNAQDYLDEYVFGGAKVSATLRDIANFYLMEPERISYSTMCGSAMYYPVSKLVRDDYFDSRKVCKRYHFENIIDLMNRGIEDVEASGVCEFYKRQIIVNIKMVIAGAEIMLAKVDRGFTKEKANEVVELFDWIIEEHKAVWRMYNYEKGIEAFVANLEARRNEVKEFIRE